MSKVNQFKGYEQYTIVPNSIFNKGLSYNALGLYVKIVNNLINGDKVYQKDLLDDTNRRTTVSKGMNELIKKGLIKKEQGRDTMGRITGIVYTVIK